jgi:hypothetical protein
MAFESGEYRVITPLDPSKGEMFVEATCLDIEEINQLYKLPHEKRIISTQLQVGYSIGEALHHVLPTQTQVWRIGNNDYLKFPQGGAQE